MNEYLIYLLPHAYADVDAAGFDFEARDANRVSFAIDAESATAALAAARAQYPRATHALTDVLIRSAGNPHYPDVLNCHTSVARPWNWRAEWWLNDPESNLAIGADFAPIPDNYMLDTGRLAHQLLARKQLGIHLFGPLNESEDQIALAHDPCYWDPTRDAAPVAYVAHMLHQLAGEVHQCECYIEDFPEFSDRIQRAAWVDPSEHGAAIRGVLEYASERRATFEADTYTWFETQLEALAAV